MSLVLTPASPPSRKPALMLPVSALSGYSVPAPAGLHSKDRGEALHPQPWHTGSSYKYQV